MVTLLLLRFITGPQLWAFWYIHENGIRKIHLINSITVDLSNEGTFIDIELFQCISTFCNAYVVFSQTKQNEL